MQINYKDVWAGLFFIAMGAAFAISAQMQLRIGSGLNMGPGYFPRFLGAVLVLLGAIIVIGALRKPNSPLGAVSWRGIILVTISQVFLPSASARSASHPRSWVALFSPRWRRIASAFSRRCDWCRPDDLRQRAFCLCTPPADLADRTMARGY